MSKICPKCGNAVSDRAVFCDKCGTQFPAPQKYDQQGGMQLNYQQQFHSTNNRSLVRTHAGVRNIFSALVHEKTTGAIVEFILWCGVCLVAVLFMTAAILVDDGKTAYVDGDYGYIRSLVGMGAHQALYIFLMIFTIGLGVLLAFRLKAIALLYEAVLFQVIMFIVYYVTNSGMIGNVQDAFDNAYYKYLESSYPAFLTVLFVLALLVGIGVVTCLSIHMFSQFNLGRIASILAMVQAGLTLLLSILMYALPSFDVLDYGESELKRQTWAEDFLSEVFSGSAYWFGSIVFFLILAVAAVYMQLFFMGIVDNRKSKIYTQGTRPVRLNGSNRMDVTGFQPGIQCIQGSLMGRAVYLQGQEISIGSQPGVSVLLQDSYVSHRHCQIRFNPSTGYYEVMDMSTNGVYNQSSGTRIPKGVYTSCQRGAILCIGSMGQQFRLL